MYRKYAKDVRMRLNLGIRRRLAPLMENGRRRIELMHNLLFSLPATPVLYYGDEIGMGDNCYLGDRKGVRTPMQWTGDRNAGFSRADSAQLYAPVISDPVLAERDLSERLGWTPVELFGETRFPTITRNPYQLSLGPYTFLWFRLERPGLAEAQA
jgi:glycosidase